MKQHLPSPGAFALAALLTCNFAAQGQHIAGQSAGRPSQASAAAQPSPTAPQILKIDPSTGGQRCPNRCCSFAALICRRLRFTLAIPTSRSNRPKSPKTDTGRSSGSTPPPRSQRPSLSPSNTTRNHVFTIRIPAQTRPENRFCGLFLRRCHVPHHD
jgi:hypothetical protein